MTFGTPKVFLRYPGVAQSHGLRKWYLILEKLLANELHDLVLGLGLGLVHHIILLMMWSRYQWHPMSMVRKPWPSIDQRTTWSTRGLLGICCGLCIHTCITVSGQYNYNMNNRQLSWTWKYNNNHFIIASRAYFQQSPPCTRVNNLVHITMWLTLIVHIAMWLTPKEFTRVNNLVHIAMWLTLNEF